MQAIIALGSNLDDPEVNLRTAVRSLSEISTSPVVCSSIWRTSPVGFEQKVPDFCNAVVVIETPLDADALLDSLKLIEKDMGRVRDATPSYESRIIDLDIIDLGGQVFESEKLTLPHPRAHQRRFVLEPLKEVIPDFRFSNRRETLEELIGEAPEDMARKSSPLHPWE